ncbi:HupE/UreJ family protein [Oceanospirillum sediminis]|uniref:HupE/UreJ family protein n=1 Tax=Oceanospirillum sediminis TaxID=2760088 RepID=A0A839INU0_9GAMM|nr:HupE/UreJ family protein [Oceanospirillum sediminis]MBB1486354.1 HupE/UreJ family protein [Oceanospirillum sediminis]
MLTALTRASLSGLALLISDYSLAHETYGPGEVFTELSFLSGFSHPFSGLDHLLVMLATGLWATHLSDRNQDASYWKIPAAFIVMMLIGGVLAASGIRFPWAESTVQISMIVTGLLLASATRCSTETGAMIAGVFALFHGIAHGSEMPPETHGMAYASGLALSVALLQLTGITLGRFDSMAWNKLNSRLAGGAIIITGLSIALV